MNSSTFKWNSSIELWHNSFLEREKLILIHWLIQQNSPNRLVLVRKVLIRIVLTQIVLTQIVLIRKVLIQIVLIRKAVIRKVLIKKALIIFTELY